MATEDEALTEAQRRRAERRRELMAMALSDVPVSVAAVSRSSFRTQSSSLDGLGKTLSSSDSSIRSESTPAAATPAPSKLAAEAATPVAATGAKGPDLALPSTKTASESAIVSTNTRGDDLVVKAATSTGAPATETVSESATVPHGAHNEHQVVKEAATTSTGGLPARSALPSSHDVSEISNTHHASPTGSGTATVTLSTVQAPGPTANSNADSVRGPTNDPSAPSTRSQAAAGARRAAGPATSTPEQTEPATAPTTVSSKVPHTDPVPAVSSPGPELAAVATPPPAAQTTSGPQVGASGAFKSAHATATVSTSAAPAATAPPATTSADTPAPVPTISTSTTAHAPPLSSEAALALPAVPAPVDPVGLAVVGAGETSPVHAKSSDAAGTEGAKKKVLKKKTSSSKDILHVDSQQDAGDVRADVTPAPAASAAAGAAGVEPPVKEKKPLKKKASKLAEDSATIAIAVANVGPDVPATAAAPVAPPADGGDATAPPKEKKKILKKKASASAILDKASALPPPVSETTITTTAPVLASVAPPPAAASLAAPAPAPITPAAAAAAATGIDATLAAKPARKTSVGRKEKTDKVASGEPDVTAAGAPPAAARPAVVPATTTKATTATTSVAAPPTTKAAVADSDHHQQRTADGLHPQPRSSTGSTLPPAKPEPSPVPPGSTVEAVGKPPKAEKSPSHAQTSESTSAAKHDKSPTHGTTGKSTTTTVKPDTASSLTHMHPTADVASTAPAKTERTPPHARPAPAESAHPAPQLETTSLHAPKPAAAAVTAAAAPSAPAVPEPVVKAVSPVAAAAAAAATVAAPSTAVPEKVTETAPGATAAALSADDEYEQRRQEREARRLARLAEAANAASGSTKPASTARSVSGPTVSSNSSSSSSSSSGPAAVVSTAPAPTRAAAAVPAAAEPAPGPALLKKQSSSALTTAATTTPAPSPADEAIRLREELARKRKLRLEEEERKREEQRIEEAAAREHRQQLRSTGGSHSELLGRTDGTAAAATAGTAAPSIEQTKRTIERPPGIIVTASADTAAAESSSASTSRPSLTRAISRDDMVASPVTPNVAVGRAINACHICRKRVYDKEGVEVERLLMHRACFRCSNARCSTTLKESNYAFANGAFYCKMHHRLYLANGPGASGSSSSISAPSIVLAPQPEAARVPAAAPTAKTTTATTASTGSTALQTKVTYQKLEDKTTSDVLRPRANSAMMTKSLSPSPSPSASPSLSGGARRFLDANRLDSSGSGGSSASASSSSVNLPFGGGKSPLASPSGGRSGKLSGKQALLEWCRQVTAGYPSVQVSNFTSSWTSGLAFCALVHRYRPSLIDYDAMLDATPSERTAKAFAASASLGILQLLDVDDVVKFAEPDELSMVTYISENYHFFKNESYGLGYEGKR